MAKREVCKWAQYSLFTWNSIFYIINHHEEENIYTLEKLNIKTNKYEAIKTSESFRELMDLGLNYDRMIVEKTKKTILFRFGKYRKSENF